MQRATRPLRGATGACMWSRNTSAPPDGSRSGQSLTYSLAWQFAAVVVPFTVLFLYQTAVELFNANAVKFELQCVTTAQTAQDQYKSFLAAAGDAGDTGILSAK